MKGKDGWQDLLKCAILMIVSMVTLVLTAFSWFILGIWYGWDIVFAQTATGRRLIAILRSDLCDSFVL